MSHFNRRYRPFAIIFALFSLTMSLLSLLDLKLERVFDAAVSATGAPGVTAPSASSARVAKDYGKLPISFEMNHGQTDKSVQFLAQGAGYTLFLRPGEAVLSLHASALNPRRHFFPLASDTLHRSSRQLTAPTPASIVRLQLIGSNAAAEAKGVDPLPGKSNYLIDNDPAKWHTDVPTYAKVRYSNVYPGIDLLYYGNQEGRLEHDLVVAPGSNPNQIEFDLCDQGRRPALKDGELTLRTKSGDLRLGAPVAYQVIRGEKQFVAASYMAAGSGHFRFRVGAYDSHIPLVIDPVLVYSAVFGGSGSDYLAAMTVDPQGDVYMTGTGSTDFPLVNPYQSTPASVFVSKLNPAGNALLYSTYLDANLPHAIAVDNSGRAYVAADVGYGNPSLIAVLNPSGDALVWSTYLGGTESGTAIALDSQANVYVTATTTTFGVVVRKFNSKGVLQYDYVLNTGGSSGAESTAIAVDANGSAYITGFSDRAGVATTPGAFRSSCRSYACVFVAKLTPAGDGLEYSTELGDFPGYTHGIAVDSAGNAYVGGEADGPGLPVWSSGFQQTFGGGQVSAFVVKVNATGSNLVWST